MWEVCWSGDMKSIERALRLFPGMLNKMSNSTQPHMHLRHFGYQCNESSPLLTFIWVNQLMYAFHACHPCSFCSLHFLKYPKVETMPLLTILLFSWCHCGVGIQFLINTNTQTLFLPFTVSFVAINLLFFESSSGNRKTYLLMHR